MKRPSLIFYDIEEADIMERAHIFNQYANHTKKIKHDYYRRISLDGSGPVMNIINQYTGQPKEMVYLASNDYP